MFVEPEATNIVRDCECSYCVCKRNGHAIVHRSPDEQGFRRRSEEYPRCMCGEVKGFEAAVKLASDDEEIRDG